MKLIEAIDLFPTLRGVRAGVDADDRRSWFIDAQAFFDASRTRGSGARLCALFILNIAGYRFANFSLDQLCERIDTAHKAAALELFAACIAKGGLQ